MDATVQALIDLALAEDIGDGDVTATWFIAAEQQGRAAIVAREPGVLSGSEVAREVWRRIDPGLQLRFEPTDGEAFATGDRLALVEGTARSIVTGERTVLNFLQRLCGIAAMTARYVAAVAPHPVQVLDTRKTTPGWRLLEKAAVRHGGGTNHRMGLYDQAMVKDNHLAADGDLDRLQKAIDRLRSARPEVGVELEADTLEQVRRFAGLRGVDWILLDNMPPDDLRKAVALAAGRVRLEASGGITLDTIGEVAATGVDAISCGALTHSVRALDLGLDWLKDQP